MLGLTTLRLGGHYLAMVTISFQQIRDLILVNWIRFTHGPDGVSSASSARRCSPSGQAYPARSRVAILAIAGYLVWRLADTRLGRAMRAVRDNETRRRATGVDVYRTKVVAFAICAVLGGIGGGLFAGGFAYVSPDQFSFSEFDRVPDDGAARRRRLRRSARCIGTGLLIVLPGMAALPEERARPVPRDLWPGGHPDHRLHAGRHLGLRARLLPTARATAALRTGPPLAVALKPAEFRGRPPCWR